MTVNPDFNGTPLFDVEYLINDTRENTVTTTTNTKWYVAYSAVPSPMTLKVISAIFL